MRELIDLLFPSRCLTCGGVGDVFCAGCTARLPLLTGPVCPRCGSPRAGGCTECRGRDFAFVSARSAVCYRRDVARALGAWKEGGAWRMARAAATIVSDVVARPSVEMLTSVPPERDRLLWRGHDPAAALARALALEWDLPFERVLRRPLGSAAQKRLDAAERRANVSGVFSPTRRSPPRIALVDDVFTTGATASAAASALREAGAVRVEVVTFARTLRTSGLNELGDRVAGRLR